ncbi:MAG: hypothetical protein RR552_07515 [Oscillospiraceae bacterium]
MDEEYSYELAQKKADEIYQHRVTRLFIPLMALWALFVAFIVATFSCWGTHVIAFPIFVDISIFPVALRMHKLIKVEQHMYKQRLRMEQERLLYKGIEFQIPDEDFKKYEKNPVAFWSKENRKKKR